MIPVLNAAQASAWDESARTESRIPSRVLMESAGRAAARVIAATFRSEISHGVIVAAGHGNNGGDGWVVARAFNAAGARVSVAETT
ncbi:MAG: NAD(P)H-hydrate epimerase, partial [Gemmatimonadales bacterium]